MRYSYGRICTQIVDHGKNCTIAWKRKIAQKLHSARLQFSAGTKNVWLKLKYCSSVYSSNIHVKDWHIHGVQPDTIHCQGQLFPKLSDCSIYIKQLSCTTMYIGRCNCLPWKNLFSEIPWYTSNCLTFLGFLENSPVTFGVFERGRQKSLTYVARKIDWSTVRYQFFHNVKKAALRCKE